MDWLNRYQRFWSDNLDRLAAFVEEDPWPPSQLQSACPRRRPRHQPSLTLKRRLNAAPEKVYAAWTDPEKLAQWFGPAQVRPARSQAEIDLRVGGRYRISFNADDGEYFEVGGVYREVVPNERLVFSWAWHSTPERESQVTVSLQAGRRRHAADAASRAVLRRGRARRPRARLDRNCSTSSNDLFA